MNRGGRLQLTVPPEAAGERLDRWLAQQLDEPRNRVQRWIRDGAVIVGECRAKSSLILSGGETVRCDVPAATVDDRIEPEAGELTVLYEDGDLVVLDKPAGLAMHPGAGRSRGTLVHRLVAAYPEISAVGGPGRPGLVHRLDLDTTGVVVVARTDAAYRALSRDFAERRVDKVYLAIAYGVPSPPEGSWTGPVGRHRSRRREMTVRADGRPARTDYRTVASIEGVSCLRLALRTGRTHQIRVHLKAAGHPLVGDPVYGEARWKGLAPRVRRPLQTFSRPALHAWKLRIDHPTTGDRLRFVAPPPDDLEALWAALGAAEGLDGQRRPG